MSQYFPKSDKRSGGNVEVELDLPNYGIQSDLKVAIGDDASNLAAKSDLTSLIAEVDEQMQMNQKLVNSVYLSQLSNVVDNDVKRL